jgi:hypothetical protein
MPVPGAYVAGFKPDSAQAADLKRRRIIQCFRKNQRPDPPYPMQLDEISDI